MKYALILVFVLAGACKPTSASTVASDDTQAAEAQPGGMPNLTCKAEGLRYLVKFRPSSDRSAGSDYGKAEIISIGPVEYAACRSSDGIDETVVRDCSTGNVRILIHRNGDYFYAAVLWGDNLPATLSCNL